MEILLVAAVNRQQGRGCTLRAGHPGKGVRLDGGTLEFGDGGVDDAHQAWRVGDRFEGGQLARGRQIVDDSPQGKPSAKGRKPPRAAAVGGRTVDHQPAGKGGKSHHLRGQRDRFAAVGEDSAGKLRDCRGVGRKQEASRSALPADGASGHRQDGGSFSAGGGPGQHDNATAGGVNPFE